jgi:hypothetical protein
MACRIGARAEPAFDRDHRLWKGLPAADGGAAGRACIAE